MEFAYSSQIADAIIDRSSMTFKGFEEARKLKDDSIQFNSSALYAPLPDEFGFEAIKTIMLEFNPVGWVYNNLFQTMVMMDRVYDAQEMINAAGTLGVGSTLSLRGLSIASREMLMMLFDTAVFNINDERLLTWTKRCAPKYRLLILEELFRRGLKPSQQTVARFLIHGIDVARFLLDPSRPGAKVEIDADFVRDLLGKTDLETLSYLCAETGAFFPAELIRERLTGDMKQVILLVYCFKESFGDFQRFTDMSKEEFQALIMGERWTEEPEKGEI
jgi:hypothetical protein